MMIDQAHETLYPHHLAGEQLDVSLEKFLAEMEAQSLDLDEDYLSEESETPNHDD